MTNKEWNGSPDPLDPDNYWIDDETKERVNAHTGERLPPRNDEEFAGFNKFLIDGDVYGSFEVFYRKAADHDNQEPPLDKDGWFWWPCYPGCMPDGDPNGPFPTAEGAYLDAIGD
jgi:hypothetical protein